MTKQNELEAPKPRILPSRFKYIHYTKEKWLALWDMGDLLNPKTVPEIWVGFEYWDEESYEKATKRMGFITGMLNGSRERSELVEIR